MLVNSFYIDTQKGRRYYAYNYQNGKINYIALKPKDITTLLKNCSESPIENIISKENYNEVIFCNGITIMIENIKVLSPQNDLYDQYFQRITSHIRDYKRTQSLKAYKQILPPHQIPKVNRKKRKSLPTKQILAGALTFTIASSLLAGLYEKEMKKKNIEELNKHISIVDHDRKKGTNEIVIEETNFIIPDNTLNLAFADRSKSDDEDEISKLEETKNYYGDIISNYATRYGLPYDLVCAQITQERPKIKNGTCENICQITYEYFVGQTMVVPIYDESGFTKEYDIFLVTKEMLDSPEGNIRVGIAYLRTCVDKFNSLITGLFSYNQGDSALAIACNYYGFDKEDYLGDENALKARDIINRYYEEIGKTHGDKDYLEHVLSYLELADRSSTVLEYYLGSEKKSIEINNTLLYNNELGR